MKYPPNTANGVNRDPIIALAVGKSGVTYDINNPKFKN